LGQGFACRIAAPPAYFLPEEELMMIRIAPLATCLCALVFVAPATTLGLPGQEAPGQAQEKPKEKDAFGKAGNATAGAMHKAGEATEKGLGAAGKGIGTAVEHTGRGVKTAAKATAGAMEDSGEAIANFFDGKPGDEDRVREVQRALQEKGYDAGPVDGIVGPKTRSGVKQFQRAENLPATGKLDEKTAERLGVE
jgi:hypothetical protein